jgi:hypothetical protein
VPARCSSTVPCTDTTRAAEGSHRSCARLVLGISIISIGNAIAKTANREAR